MTLKSRSVSVSRDRQCILCSQLLTSLSLLLSLQFPLIILLHLLRSIASLCADRSYSHILVHKLFPCSPGPTFLSSSLSFQSNTLFTQSLSSFLKTCLCHLDLFLWTTFTMSSIPNCCLNSTQDSLSLNFAPHIHPIILILAWCNASSFSGFKDHVSLL